MGQTSPKIKCRGWRRDWTRNCGDGASDDWREAPYLVIDARYEHVREDGHVVSEGILTVKGINGQGYREVIGVAVAPGEDGES